MSEKKPKPLNRRAQPKVCPVCGKASYSAAGVHPQCSARQADIEFAASRKKDDSKTGKSTGSKSGKKPTGANVSRWQKTCPKCKASLHVRRNQCDCGHSFKSQV